MIKQIHAGIEDWDNEGGAVRPAAATAAPAVKRGSRAAGLPPHRRSPRDTVAGCRDAAEADLMKAAVMDTANGRLRHEHSAAAWTARGDLLQRLDEGWHNHT